VQSSFLCGSVFVALHSMESKASDQQQQWLAAFTMLAFYLFLTAIILALPAAGWGSAWRMRDIKFTLNTARYTYPLIHSIMPRHDIHNLLVSGSSLAVRC
jgi:hypothetical protein